MNRIGCRRIFWNRRARTDVPGVSIPAFADEGTGDPVLKHAGGAVIGGEFLLWWWRKP